MAGSDHPGTQTRSNLSFIQRLRPRNSTTITTTLFLLFVRGPHLLFFCFCRLVYQWYRPFFWSQPNKEVAFKLVFVVRSYISIGINKGRYLQSIVIPRLPDTTCCPVKAVRAYIDRTATLPENMRKHELTFFSPLLRLIET